MPRSASSLGLVLAVGLGALTPACTRTRPPTPTHAGEIGICEYQDYGDACGVLTYDPATDTLLGVWRNGESGSITLERRPDGSIVLDRHDTGRPGGPTDAHYVGTPTEEGYQGRVDGSYHYRDGERVEYHSNWRAIGRIPERPVDTGPPPPPGCRPVDLGTTRFAFCDGARSFADARAYCEARTGWTLASPESPAENDLIASNLTGPTWIGASDESAEGRMVWPGGAAVLFTHWCAGEPNDSGGGEDCALFEPVGFADSPCWNDVPCGRVEAFACETGPGGVPTSGGETLVGMDAIGPAPSRGEADAWTAAAGSWDRESYQAYLAAYPDGPHAAEAQEMLAFDDALEADDLGRWQDLVARHPQSPMLDFARARVTELAGDEDADGIVGVADYCPVEAEVRNGHDDGDGCPDAPAEASAISSVASEFVWAPRAEVGDGQVATTTADARDGDLAWIVTTDGDVLRMQVATGAATRVGHVARRITSLVSVSGMLVARAQDGALLTSTDGGASWQTPGWARAAASDLVRCGDRLWTSSAEGVAVVEAGVQRALPGPTGVVALACAGDDVIAGGADGRVRRVSAAGVVSELGAVGGLVRSVASSGGQVFAIGDGGRVLRSEAGSWTDTGLVASRLFTNGADLYAVDDVGGLRRFTSGGWTAGEPGTEGQSVREVRWTSRGDMLLTSVGSRSRVFFRTRVSQRQTLVGSVLFGSGSAAPGPGLVEALDAVVRAYRPGRRVRIEGHTDAVGDPEANIVLSRARADTVRRVLVEHGVPDAAISTEGYGALRPVGDNRRTAGRSANRRVEILFFDDVPVTSAGATAPAAAHDECNVAGHWEGVVGTDDAEGTSRLTLDLTQAGTDLVRTITGTMEGLGADSVRGSIDCTAFWSDAGLGATLTLVGGEGVVQLELEVSAGVASDMSGRWTDGAGAIGGTVSLSRASR